MRTELRRQSTADRWLLVLLAVLVAVTCALAAGSTAWLRVTADAMFTKLWDDAPRAAQTLRIRITGMAPGVRMDSDSARFGRQVTSWLNAPLPQAVGDGRVAVSGPQFTPTPIPAQSLGVLRNLTVASFPDLGELVTWTAGRAPRPGVRRDSVPPEVERAWREPWLEGIGSRVVEVGLTERAAEALRMPVGTYAQVGLHPVSTPDSGAFFPLIKVTGIYEPVAPAPSRLDDLTLTRGPSIVRSGPTAEIYATALAADPDTVLGFWGGDRVTTQWTFPPVGTVGAGQAAELRRAVDHLEVTAAARVPGPGSVLVETVTGLDDLAATFLERRAASDALLLIPRVAVFACAVITVALSARVLSRRRRTSTRLFRARGGSIGQLLARRGTEAALLVLPGVVVGVIVATAVAGGGPALQDVAAAGAAAACCAALLTAFGVFSVPTVLRRERLRRIALDGAQAALVVLAAVTAWAVSGRDVFAAPDPLLALTPVLVAGAVAVLGMRLISTGLRRLQRLSRTGRGLVPMLGLGRAAALTRQFALPAAGIVLATAAAAMSLTMAAGLPAEVTGRPVVERTTLVLRGGVLAAAVFAALGIVFAVALTDPSRRRTASLLRVLGARRRQSAAPAAAEVAPAAAFAALLGGGTGWLLLLLLEPASAPRVLAGAGTESAQAVAVATGVATAMSVVAAVAVTVVGARSEE